MTHLYLVRHGPTHEKAFVGWRDVPADLSDLGAIDRMKAFLPDNAIAVSSDLIRAISTADAVAPEQERLPHDPRLREFNFGVWDGVLFDDIARDYPDLSRAFWETPGDIAPPDGESWNDVAARVGSAIDDLLHFNKPLVVVAHIGVIMTQIARAEGKGAYAALGHKIDPLSVTQIAITDGNWELVTVNHKP